jgi:hypothetical protein
MVRESLPDELRSLADAVCSETASDEQIEAIGTLLEGDKAAQRFFLGYCRLHTELLFSFRGQQAHQSALAAIRFQATVAASPSMLGIISATDGSTGWLSSGWPVAYLIAAAILGVGLLVGAVTRVSQPLHIVQHTPTLPAPLSPLPCVVGQITGAVECQFAADSKTKDPSQKSEIGNPNSETISKSPNLQISKSLVHLGDRFNLVSGLLEITYDTGARVILQGPVSYEVESHVGGFLSLGKLTARVENSTEYGVLSTGRMTNKSKAISKSPNLQISKFVVRTPTATVTDLGTEFGIEVDRQGATISHVFRGSVRVQLVGNGGELQGLGRVLHDNESVQVDSGVQRKIVVVQNLNPVRFVREIPRRQVKVLDLADIVAGGDGTSSRRGRGLNPANGAPADSPLAHPSNANLEDLSRFRMTSDGRYHRTKANPFVDGVFIPGSRESRVQVDSVGHVFSEFGPKCNAAAGNIWAGGTIPVLTSSMPRNVAALLPSLPPDKTLMPTSLDGVDYAGPSHGLIFLPANNGITFDLEAIRRAHPEARLARFHAVAGNTEIASDNGLYEVSADLCVLVDGSARFRRRDFNKYMGVFPISVPLADGDRFLTLVATDGGNDIGFDWLLFGDPVLELSIAAPERQGITPPKQPGQKRR